MYDGFKQYEGVKRNPSREVTDFHLNDDLDVTADSHHHTLGLGPTQAAPGNLVKELQDEIDTLKARLTAAGIP